MRRVVIAPVACAAVVGAVLLAAGQDRSGPAPEAGAAATPSTRPVSDAEFCDGFGRLAAAQQRQLQAPGAEAVAELKAAAQTVSDLAEGTTLTDPERRGVAYVVEAFLGLPDDATAQDVIETDDGATLADDANAQALAAFIGDACGAGSLSQAG